MKRQKDRHTVRQTYREKDILRDLKIKRQKDRQTGRQTDRETDRQRNRHREADSGIDIYKRDNQKTPKKETVKVQDVKEILNAQRKK